MEIIEQLGNVIEDKKDAKASFSIDKKHNGKNVKRRKKNEKNNYIYPENSVF